MVTHNCSKLSESVRSCPLHINPNANLSPSSTWIRSRSELKLQVHVVDTIRTLRPRRILTASPNK